MSGGPSNSDPNASLGAGISGTLIDDPSKVFDQISHTESWLGDTEYRCVYVKNTHGSESYLGLVGWVIQAVLPATLGGGDAPEHMEIVFDPVGIGDGTNDGVASTVATEETPPALKAPANPAAVGTTGGSLGAGTYYYIITAINTNGETIGSSEASATIDGAATTAVAVSWDAVAGADSYRVYGRATGAQDKYWSEATTSFTDTGGAGSAGTVPVTNTATFVWPVSAPEAEIDAIGNYTIDGGKSVPLWIKRTTGPNVTVGYTSKPAIRFSFGG